MAVNEETSVYVGGLPNDADEDMLRGYFEPCGTIVSIKVINDQRIRGKCYGFITYTDPTAAQHAIMQMDGKKIGNHAVRVNEVHTRGNKCDSGHDGFRRDPIRHQRDGYWDQRDRERSYDRHLYRDSYHDRDSDPCRPKARAGRDISSSGDDLHNDVKRQLDKAIQMRKDLENEVSLIKDKITTKEHHIAGLQKKSQKLEKQLAAARKVSSGQLLVARKLYKYLLELQGFDDRAKNAENDLKALIHATRTEIDMAEDATTRDGSGYENIAL